MNAHIRLSRKQRDQINKDVRIYAQEAVKKEREDLVRRVFKLILVVLNKKFKFGGQRGQAVVDETLELLKIADEDEIFWEHIDKLVIDRMGLPFERDYTR